MRSGNANRELCRVAHVSLQLDMGGMEKLLVEFARHADRARYHLDFISLTDRGALADEIESLGWNVHAMDKRPGLKLGLPFRLGSLFRVLGAEVVHTHNDAACLYGVVAARMARVPAVFNTRHGQGARRGPRQTKAFSWAARLADKVACVSKDSAEIVVGLGVPSGRVLTIWNGIDLERFAFSGPCEGGPAILVARLSPEKNIECLLRALRRVVAVRPGFRLQLVGDGPSRDSLERLAFELGLRGCVEFTGQRRDVVPLLSRASMFVLPSFTEGVSISLLEAMATGLPVVATRVGGNTEVVEDGRTGLLVESNDEERLAEAICLLASSRDIAYKIGRAGRDRVEKAFNVRAMVAAYERLYEGRSLATH